jgi:hypothetical protein
VGVESASSTDSVERVGRVDGDVLVLEATVASSPSGFFEWSTDPGSDLAAEQQIGGRVGTLHASTGSFTPLGTLTDGRNSPVISWAPTGHRFAVTSSQRPTLCEVDNQLSCAVIEGIDIDPDFAPTVVWAPVGKILAVSGTAGGYLESQSRTWVVNAATGAATRLKFARFADEDCSALGFVRR